MENIINLIRLQFNSLFSQKRSMLILVLLGLFFAVVQPTMIIFVGAMFLMVACYSIIYYEERSKVNYLIYSLPVTIKEYIASKYIYGLINTVIAIVISLLLTIVIKTIGFNEGFALVPIYVVPLVTFILGVFFNAIVMPATLLLGFEKGRFVIMILAILPMTCSTGLVELLPKINFTISPIMITILGVLVTITVLLASYFITVNKFSKKEIQ